MTDTVTSELAEDEYPLTMRLAALAGLVLVGALAFILIDIAAGGRLTGCTDCKETAGG